MSLYAIQKYFFSLVVIFSTSLVSPFDIFYLDDFNSSASILRLGRSSGSSVALKGFRNKTLHREGSVFQVTLNAPNSSGILFTFFYVHFTTKCGGGEEVKLITAGKNVTLCGIRSKHKGYAEIFDANDVTVSYAVRGPTTNLSFDFTATAFLRRGSCGSGGFDCRNGLCVWSGLVCDGRNNCGNDYDETNFVCFETDGGTKFLGKVILIVFGVFLLTFVGCFLMHILLMKRHTRMLQMRPDSFITRTPEPHSTSPTRQSVPATLENSDKPHASSSEASSRKELSL